MPPRALTPSTPGGLLDPNQTTLSANARRTMQNLVAQGIAPNIARQLAIALNKSAVTKAAPRKGYHEAFAEAAKAILPRAMVNMLHVNARAIAGGHGKAARRDELAAGVQKTDGHVPPKGVQAACRRGLDLAGEYGGPGLTAGAKARARRMANGEAQSDAQLARIRSFTARHDSYEKQSSPPSPGYVSWLLWGGDAGKAWAGAKVDNVTKSKRLLAAVKGQKPMGAAFAHARASGKKQDHESRKRRASAYLRSKGHSAIGKSAPLLADVRAETFLKIVREKKKKKDSLAATQKSVSVHVPATIIKSEQPDWQRLVWSVVYEPDTVDAHGDFMDAETIEKAAHNALREGIYVNSEHRGEPLPATVVESYIAPCDFTLSGAAGDTLVRKGTWVMGMHVTDDAAWKGVLDGTYRGFSLEGLAMAHAA